MPIVIVGVFITVLTIVFGAYLLLVVRPEQQESGAVRRRLKGNQPRIVKAELGKAEEALSTVGPLDVALRHWTGVSAPLQMLLQRSGLKLSVGALVLLSVFCAVVAGLLVRLLTVYSLPALGTHDDPQGVPHERAPGGAARLRADARNAPTARQ